MAKHILDITGAVKITTANTTRVKPMEIKKSGWFHSSDDLKFLWITPN